MPHVRRSVSWSCGAVLAVLLAVAAPAATLGGQVCGNGVVEAGEDCDDGDLFDLDGCDRSCRYEQIQRLTSLVLQSSAAPSFCDPTTNQLGGTFTAVGLPVFNSTLQQAIDAGQLAILLDLLDLDDATGQNDPAIELGVLGGSPDLLDPSPGGLDAWYLVGGDALGPDGLPSERLTPGAISALDLSAGPSDIAFPFVGGDLSVRGTRLAALVGTTTSLPDPPPAELAPGFVAFEALDGSGAGDGICGNVTVGTLAAIPVPDEVTVGGTQCRDDCADSRAYVSCAGGPVTASCHSLLDVLVGGCRVAAGCLITVTEPTQPDVGVGGNPPNVLEFAPTGGGIEKVTVVEPDDAYSSWFQFASERVHVTDNLGALFRDGFESGDTTLWSSTVP